MGWGRGVIPLTHMEAPDPPWQLLASWWPCLFLQVLGVKWPLAQADREERSLEGAFKGEWEGVRREQVRGTP